MGLTTKFQYLPSNLDIVNVMYYQILCQSQWDWNKRDYHDYIIYMDWISGICLRSDDGSMGKKNNKTCFGIQKISHGTGLLPLSISVERFSWHDSKTSYPLVNVYITMERSTMLSMGKYTKYGKNPLCLWSFSIAKCTGWCPIVS